MSACALQYQFEQLEKRDSLGECRDHPGEKKSALVGFCNMSSTSEFTI